MTSLRNYQKRLSNFAQFRSAIICLPTGSGKTMIAATCLKHDIEMKMNLDKTRGALFLVPTCLLVTQQANALTKETGLKVAQYMGGSAKPDNFDILVSTPAAFLALSNYQEYGLHHFSRVVFDEIHHVVKRHPYRLIARKLVSIHPNPPLILGLTASLTYATNAANIKQAIEDICYEFSIPIDSVISATKEELRTDGYHAVDIQAIVSTPNDFLLVQDNLNDGTPNASYSNHLGSAAAGSLSSIQELPGHSHEYRQDFIHFVTNRYAPPLHPVTLIMMDIVQRIEAILKQDVDRNYQSPIFELNKNTGDWSEHIIHCFRSNNSSIVKHNTTTNSITNTNSNTNTIINATNSTIINAATNTNNTTTTSNNTTSTNTTTTSSANELTIYNATNCNNTATLTTPTTTNSTINTSNNNNTSATTATIISDSLYYYLEHLYEAARLIVNSRQLGLEMAIHYLKMTNVLSADRDGGNSSSSISSSSSNGSSNNHSNGNDNNNNDNSNSSSKNNSHLYNTTNTTNTSTILLPGLPADANSITGISALIQPLHLALDEYHSDFNRLEHLKEVLLQEYYRHHSSNSDNCHTSEDRSSNTSSNSSSSSKDDTNVATAIAPTTNHHRDSANKNKNISTILVNDSTSAAPTTSSSSSSSSSSLSTNTTTSHGLRCIIFVQQRISTHILHHFIQNDIDFQYLNIKSNIIYAAKTPATIRLSTSKSQIAHRIHQFSIGELQILIATSVAEEGMDIPAANCVIRFDAIQTPVSLVQSRGRARHENSKFHVLQHNNSNNSNSIIGNISNASSKNNTSSNSSNDTHNISNSNHNNNQHSNRSSTNKINNNTTTTTTTTTKSRSVASLEAAEQEQMRVIHACSSSTAATDFAISLKRKREAKLNRDRSARVYLERYQADPVKYNASSMLNIYCQKIAAELNESVESAVLTIDPNTTNSSSNNSNNSSISNSSSSNSNNSSSISSSHNTKSNTIKVNSSHSKKVGWKVTYTLFQYGCSVPPNDDPTNSRINNNSSISFSSVSECKKRAKSQVAEMFMNHLIATKLK